MPIVIQESVFTSEDLAEYHQYFEYSIRRSGHELLNDEHDEPWLQQTAADHVFDAMILEGGANDFSWFVAWGRGQGSVGDFDGDGYRDYVIRSRNYSYLYRGGDRLDRRDNNADAVVHTTTGNGSVAGLLAD